MQTIGRTGRVIDMGTKRSLIEVVHDEGYGDALLMHINHAFGSRDMRADDAASYDAEVLRDRRDGSVQSFVQEVANASV
jgi:hypothetical protein